MTISEPFGVKWEPYGVCPDDRTVAGAVDAAVFVDGVVADAVGRALGHDQRAPVPAEGHLRRIGVLAAEWARRVLQCDQLRLGDRRPAVRPDGTPVE